MILHTALAARAVAATQTLPLLLCASFSDAANARSAADVAGSTQTSTSVETEVKTALRMQGKLSQPEEINVEDKRGTVTLSGTVPNDKEAERAVEVTRSISGVHAVNDDLIRKSNEDLDAKAR